MYRGAERDLDRSVKHVTGSDLAKHEKEGEKRTRKRERAGIEKVR